MKKDLEAEFRRRFVASLKTHCLCEYMSSMNKKGVPDVHLIVRGRVFWLELKALEDLPARGNSNILSHRFDGTQLAFLDRVNRNGGDGLGVIGFRDSQRIWHCTTIRRDGINDDGTVTKDRYLGLRPLAVDHTFGPRFITLINRI